MTISFPSMYFYRYFQREVIFTVSSQSEEVQFAIPLDIDLTQISRRLGTSSAKLWSGISLQVSRDASCTTGTSFEFKYNFGSNSFKC